MNKVIKTLKENFIFLLMVLPGVVWFVLFFYIPVLGNVVAFKNFKLSGEGFIHSLMSSECDETGVELPRVVCEYSDVFS